MVVRESLNSCCASNSPLAPGRPTNRGGPRFRVQSLLHLVNPTFWRVAFSLMTLSRCWSKLCLRRRNGDLHTIDRILGATGPIDRGCSLKWSLNLRTTRADLFGYFYRPALVLSLRVMPATNYCQVVLESRLNPGQIIQGLCHLIFVDSLDVGWPNNPSQGEVDTCLQKQIELSLILTSHIF